MRRPLLTSVVQYQALVIPFTVKSALVIGSVKCSWWGFAAQGNPVVKHLPPQHFQKNTVLLEDGTNRLKNCIIHEYHYSETDKN